MKSKSVENIIINLLANSIYIYVLIFAVIYTVMPFISLWLQFSGRRPIGYDIYWFDNALFNMVQGNGFFTVFPNHYNISTINQYPLESHFHQHNQPILFLMLPIYYFFKSIYTLFVIQAIWLSAAAIPLYLICKEFLDELSSKIIAISYLIYPPIFWISIMFYPESMTPLFVFMMIYFYIKNKYRLFCLSFFLLLMLKEDLPLILFPLGIYLLYDTYKGKVFAQNTYNKLKYVLTIIIISPLYFILSMYIIAHFTGGSYEFVNRYSELGNSTFDIIKNMISKPGLFIFPLFSVKTFVYLIQMLLPVSLIPMLSLTTFLTCIPVVLENTLSNAPAQVMFTEHYQFGLTSIIFLSVIVGFIKIKKQNANIFEIWELKYLFLSIFWFVVFSVIRFCQSYYNYFSA